jgi:putative mRNA 3-end processing factor
MSANAGSDAAGALIVVRSEGLYCPSGDFYIDPWRPVERAVVTHAHADHASFGHARYLCSSEGEPIVRARLGDIALQTLQYGERLHIGAADVSLHPAGHVRGSAQVRIEAGGAVCVVSGDYKLDPDPTCTPFEPVRCHAFVTEATFGLPIYRWQPPAEVLAEIAAWWADNAAAGRTSVLYCYALGKAQRILAGLAQAGPLPGALLVHGAIDTLNRAYREGGAEVPATAHATGFADREQLARALVLAPPSASGTTWPRRFGDHGSGFASGWMQVRGARRQRRVDRGFVLSDHADWPGLLRAAAATGAQQILVTHGFAEPLARYLAEQGLRTAVLRTEYGAEDVAPGVPQTSTRSEETTMLDSGETTSLASGDSTALGAGQGTAPKSGQGIE